MFTMIFKQKRNEYLIFFLGRYPENIRHGFKAILDSKSIFRYSISSACMVIRFDTNKKLDEVRDALASIYDGYADSFFIFDVKSNHTKVLDATHYKHLYDKTTVIGTPDHELSRLHEFILTLQQMKSNILKLIDENKDSNDLAPPEEKPTIADIDPILDKIKEMGINSLTENEKLILKKYTNDD